MHTFFCFIRLTFLSQFLCSWLLDCHVYPYHSNGTNRRTNRESNRPISYSAARRRHTRSSLSSDTFDYSSPGWSSDLNGDLDGESDPASVYQVEKDRKEFMMETSRVLDNLLQDYDNRLRPSFGGPPVFVNVTLHVDSLGPISETEMSFRVDFAFRQYWRDERLTFETTMNNDITLSHEFLGKIWLPDTYFPESLSANKHDVMVPNILLRLSPDGTVLYSSRVTVHGKCPMNLENFPLDTQDCSLIIEAYGYTTEDLSLQWKEEKGGGDAVAVSDAIELSQFSYRGHEKFSYTLSFSTGNFSDLEVSFKFERTILYFVLQSYVPATLIVMLSWVSFWVDARSIPARAALSITTVLTMITLTGTVNSQLPKVSNIKALDVYFGMCFFYVFAALIEFSAVCYLDKKSQKIAERKKEEANLKKAQEEQEMKTFALLKEVDCLTSQPPNDNLSNQQPGFGSGRGGNPLQPFEHVNGGTNSHTYAPNSNYQSSAGTQKLTLQHEYSFKTQKAPKRPFNVLRVDNYSRVVFPTTFMILNLIYWGIYTNLVKNI